MRQKSLFGLGMALVMSMTCAFPVLAADTDSTSPVDTVVNFKKASTYTLNIPKNVTLSEDESVTQTISASKVNIEYAAKLDIQVGDGLEDDSKVILTRKEFNDMVETHAKASSVLKVGTEPVTKDTILVSYQNIDATPVATLTYEALEPVGEKKDQDGKLLAGEYEGTITFTCKINFLD